MYTSPVNFWMPPGSPRLRPMPFFVKTEPKSAKSLKTPIGRRLR